LNGLVVQNRRRMFAVYNSRKRTRNRSWRPYRVGPPLLSSPLRVQWRSRPTMTVRVDHLTPLPLSFLAPLWPPAGANRNAGSRRVGLVQ